MKSIENTETQCRFISNNEIVNEVITLQEATEILGIHDSTLRKKVLKGNFENWQYRKTTRVILFNKDVILKLRNKK